MTLELALRARDPSCLAGLRVLNLMTRAGDEVTDRISPRTLTVVAPAVEPA